MEPVDCGAGNCVRTGGPVLRDAQSSFEGWLLAWEINLSGWAGRLLPLHHGFWLLQRSQVLDQIDQVLLRHRLS
jgi:hypothetical protein